MPALSLFLFYWMYPTQKSPRQANALQTYLLLYSQRIVLEEALNNTTSLLLPTPSPLPPSYIFNSEVPLFPRHLDLEIIVNLLLHFMLHNSCTRVVSQMYSIYDLVQQQRYTLYRPFSIMIHWKKLRKGESSCYT
jgi:hypothetical protein